MITLPALLVYAVLLLFVVAIFLLRQLRRDHIRLQSELESLRFAKQSQSTKYGKLSEQFMPFLDHYPYNPQSFRFIGTPIDGIQFQDDKIIFMEFKTGGSQLSALQRQIKSLIQAGQVEWAEFVLREENK